MSDEYSQVIYNFLSSLRSIADRGTFTKPDRSEELITNLGAKPSNPWTEQRSGLVTRVRYNDNRFS